MKKSLKLVGLLALFIVLIVPLVYLVSSVRSLADENLLRMTSLEVLTNKSFLSKGLIFTLTVLPLGWLVIELTDMTRQVNLLFSSISFCLESILGFYLLSTNDGSLSVLPFAGGIISFFMSLLLIRTCLIWQERRAIKKTEWGFSLFSFFLIK